jgi:hypothetical protein
MRGISEVRSANENPHHRFDEHFGVGRHTDGADANRSFESNLAAKNRRDAILASILSDRARSPREGSDGVLASILSDRSREGSFGTKGDAVLAAILTDLVMGAAIKSILFSPGPACLDEDEPEADAAAEDDPEDDPEDEVEAAAPAPVGSLTFIGKDFEDLRAIPAPLHDGHRAYHGEFRHGSVWRTVHSSGGAISYASPEAAIFGARNAKNHCERNFS